MDSITGMVVFVLSCGDVKVQKKGVYIQGLVFFQLGDVWVLSPRECVEHMATGDRAAVFHCREGVVYKAPGQTGFVAVKDGVAHGGGNLAQVEGWLTGSEAA